MDKIPGAKNDDGKLDLSLVPPEIIEAVAHIRRYGNMTYEDPQNWKRVEASKFHQALLRHVLAMWEDWESLDDESGYPHLWHLCCNAAFLCALYRKTVDVMETIDDIIEKCFGGDEEAFHRWSRGESCGNGRSEDTVPSSV